MASISEILGESALEKGRLLSLLEREVLLAYVLDVGREYLISHSNEEVEQGDFDLYVHYINRASAGEPLAYITNSKEFYGINFYVDKRVLVPRPETEQMVEVGLSFIADNYLDYHTIDRDSDKNSLSILDVGTGSGNIILALADTILKEYLPNFVLDFYAVDVSQEAVEVARINAEQLGVENDVQIFQSDLLENFDDGEEFDMIFANLPYIGEEKFRFVEKKVEKFEPGVALFGGSDGLELYRKMFKQLEEKEIKFKFLMGEFGFAQKNDLEKLLKLTFPEEEFNFYFLKDLAEIDRFFVIEKI